MRIIAEASASRDDVCALVTGNAGCEEALLARDGSRAVLVFEAPDRDAVASALGARGIDAGGVWEATLHRPAGEAAREVGSSEPPAARPEVVVERSFEAPVALDDVQALEDRGAWCLDLHGVRFLRTYFSRDRRRMLCVYDAPDAESVRIAQQTIGMPVERVWSAEVLR